MIIFETDDYMDVRNNICNQVCNSIFLMGKRELIALLNLSSWCIMMVERLFLAVPRGCLQFVIVVFPDQAHLLFLECDVNNGLNRMITSEYWSIFVC